MHSKHKVNARYPMINKTHIQMLYGFNVKGLKKSMWDIRSSLPTMFESLEREFSKDYNDLNKLNLTQFYRDTVPVKVSIK